MANMNQIDIQFLNVFIILSEFLILLLQSEFERTAEITFEVKLLPSSLKQMKPMTRILKQL